MNEHDLNERAARAARLKARKCGMSVVWYLHPSTKDFICRVNEWNPAGDPDDPNEPGNYNHAHLLYAEVVRRDKKFAFYMTIQRMFNTFEAMDLTPAQLTLACCEVLEADNERTK